MLAMTAVGAIPSMEECISGNSIWLYWMTWDYLVNKDNTDAHLVESYNHPRVVTVESIRASVLSE